MSEGMEAQADAFTPEDFKALRQLARRERPYTMEEMAEVPEGTIVMGEESRELFSFEAPEIGQWRFDVRSIKDAIADRRMSAWMFRLDDVPESFYEHVRTNNGVEPDRLAKITGPDLERPGIMVHWPDGHSTLIDGNHRLVRRGMLGLRGFRFIMVDVKDCAPYMCRPGDEVKLFAKDRPGVQTLHTEIKVEE